MRSTFAIPMRCPDPSCNPYLAFAVMLASGLDGIRRNLTEPGATEENLYTLDESRRAALNTLPGSLPDALNALEADEVICAALGAHLVTRFVHAKRME